MLLLCGKRDRLENARHAGHFAAAEFEKHAAGNAGQRRLLDKFLNLMAQREK